MSKTRMGKRVASLLLSLVMMLSLLPTTVYAEGADTGATNDAVVEETIAPVNAEGVDAVANAESSEDEQPDGADNVTSSAVAKIGDKEYATLKEAIADVQDGQTVTLTANVEVADLTLDKTVTIKSEGETQYEIKGLKAIAGTGVTLDNVYLNLTQTLEIGGINTTLTNCTIRAKDLGYSDIADGATTGFTGGKQWTDGAYSYLTKVTGSNVTMTDCVIDGTDKDNSFFPNMCLAPVSGTDVTMTRCTFNEGFGACYYSTPHGTWTLDGCKFTNIYCYNIQAGDTAADIVVKNCELAGWTSFGDDMESVSFEKCSFAKSSGYATIVAHKDVTFTDCTFTEDYKANLYVEDNTAVELNGCKVVDTNGNESTTVGLTDIVDTQGKNTNLAAIDATKDAEGYTGGTFVGSKSAIDAVLADGYTYDNATGTVTPAAATTAVAKIGEQSYATLKEAIAAAKDGDTVTLLKDATEDVEISKNIILDLNGFTLTNTNAGKATISVSNGATATVKGGFVVGGTSYYNIEVTKGSNANLTLEDVTATAGNTGSSMIDNWGTLTINSGTYTGGLNVVKSEPRAKLAINGGKFELNYSQRYDFTAVILTYGDTTISDGEFVQSATTYQSHPMVVMTSIDKNDVYTPSTIITGGVFTNNFTTDIFWAYTPATYNNFKVTGGTFNKNFSEKYCADGFIPVKNGNGTYGVKEGKFVAKIGTTGYETLEKAIAAATPGKTVKLLEDVAVTAQLVIEKRITLDLNNFTLTSTYAMSEATSEGRYALVNNAALTIKDGTFAVGQARAIGAYGNLTLNNVTVTQKLTGGHACVAFCKANGTYKITNSIITGAYAVCSFAHNATINITGSTLNGSGCGLYHNGSNYGLKLTVTDTKINGSLDGAIGNENDPSGVYISGSTATVEKGGMQSASFTNCTIKGATAIEVKYTNLTLDKCTVEATVKTPSYSKNNNGMTALGFAVVSTDNSMNSATPKPEGTITITGDGKYTGLVGLGALASVKTYEGFTDNTIKVSGGTFNSAVMPEYCAEDYVPTQNEDGSYGVREANYVAQVLDKNGNPVGVKYESLQAAIDKASRNATVKLLANTRENVTISTPYLTLDLNGFTLNGSTGERKPALTITARVTVKDSSDPSTGTIMREDTAENSGVSSHYVIDVQGAGWLTFESGNVKNNSGNAEGKGASLVRVGDDSVAKYPGLNIKGGTFTQNNFIVIKVDSGDLFLNGGTLNSTGSYAIEDWHRATIKGGTVNGDVAAWTYSGGHNSDLSIEGGTITGDVTSVNYGNAEGKVAKVSITGGAVNGELGTYTYSNGLTATTDATKATIAVTGGTFKKNPIKYVVEDSAVTENEDNTFGVAKAYLAMVGETSYYTMDEAFKAQTASSKPIVLLRDYTTGSTFSSGSINRTVDLNGHTWTCTGTDANSAAFEINYSDVTLTVKNGKIVSSQLVGLIPSAIGGTIKYDNSSLTFENVEMSTTATSGIETNGNNTNDSVTLKNSTLNVPDGFGIYFPSSGTLTIDNSTINAKTMGVQVCAGSLSINAGSTITVSGDAVPKTENDGAIQDGAAISIVNRGYKPFGEIAITGGTFESKVAAIKAYDWDNTNKVEKTFTANEKVAVSGGSFSSAVPEGLCAEGYIPTKNEGGTYGVKEGTYVAEYNGTKYTSLQEAIDAASHRNGGQTEVKLLCDLTITETVNFAKEYSVGSVLLNLGGYTLTGEDCRALQINKGNLYLENGTVTSTGIIDSSSVIRIGSNEATYNGATPMLYMQKDAKVVAPDSYGVTIFGSATRGEKLKVMSNAEIIATGPSPAISGNGGANYNTDDRTSGWKAEEIIIGENAVISAANNYAIYHPECGKLDIQGGTITGTGGIQMCSGTLKISNSPKITANGSADYDYTGDAGVVYDAAAISVINRGYPQGPATATIKGTPTVTAANGEVIHAFTWSNSNKTDGDWAEAGDKINVSGGTYSKTFNEAYLAADCTLVAGENGTYTVEQKKVAEYNGTQYTSLSQAILDANKAGGTVKLLDNVTLTSNLGIGGAVKVTLDLNKKTLTLAGAQIYTQGSAAVIINSGTIKRIDTPTSGSANNFAIQVMSGSSLILGAGTGSTYKVTLESTYGIYNVGGTLTVRYATINTDGWSIAVSDSASTTGEVYIGRGMGSNTKTVITSKSGNVLGTMVNSKPNVTIDYGTLTSNGTTWDAGVVYWASEGTLTITGGIFNASSVEGSKAAAVYQKNGTVKISGTTAKLLGSTALVVQAGEGSTGTMVTELSGGTYSTKPDEAWVVEGKEIHEVDGLYKVEGPYVVEVTHADGTVHKFDSWSKAFYSAEAQAHNATVKLLTDIETTSTVTTWATVTVDFNGHTLTVNGSGVAAITALTKGTAANVTLMDSVGNGGMKTTGVYGVTVRGTGATATVKSGSYNCNTSVVQVENGTAYIEGGTFQTKDTDKSYLLNCIDAAFAAGTANIEVTGGTFNGFDPSANPEGEGTTYVKAGYVSTNNGDGTFTVAEGKFTVQVTSRTVSSNTPVAHVSGGGNITYAEGTTATTTTVAGYEFVGWYVDNYPDGEYLGKELTISYKPTADCTLVAVYKPISGGTFELKVDASKFKVNGGATNTSKFSGKLAANSLVTIKFTGDNFLYWVNGSGKVVSTLTEYTFTLVSATVLSAVYTNSEADEAQVIFLTANPDDQNSAPQIVSSRAYAKDTTTISFPAPPVRIGKSFTGWSMTQEQIIAAIPGANVERGGKILVYAMYKDQKLPCTVTVFYGAKQQEIAATIGTRVELTAPQQVDRKEFSCWKDSEGKVLGTTRNLYVTPVGDMTVYAVYGETVEQLPTISMLKPVASVANEKYVVTFSAVRSIPDGYTIEELGILYSMDSSYGNSDAKEYMVLGSDGEVPAGVYRARATQTTPLGTVRCNITTGSADRTFYARGYMILKDSEGNIAPYYSEIASGSYNSLTNGGN